MNRRALVVLTGLLVLGTGCTPPPWEETEVAPLDDIILTSLVALGPSGGSGADVGGRPKATGQGDPEASPTADVPESNSPAPEAVESPAPTPTKAAPTFTDEFAEGTITRLLNAGSTYVKVNIWSTLPRQEWSPNAVKPLAVEITADGSPDVELMDAQLIAEALTSDGWTNVTTAVQQPKVADGVNITAPRSASLTTVIGQVPADAVALRLTVVVNVIDTRGKFTVQSSATASFVTALPGG